MLDYVYLVPFIKEGLSIYSIRDFVRICEELKVGMCLSVFFLCFSASASCFLFTVLFRTVLPCAACLLFHLYPPTMSYFLCSFFRLYYRPTDIVNLYAHARATSILDSLLTSKLLFC